MLSFKKQLLCGYQRFSFFFKLSMTTSTDIANLRKEYNSKNNTFLETALASKDPIKLFRNWLEHACSVPGIAEPNAMTLATVKDDGRPAARMVLLKGYDENGFRFFSNYRSSKAKDLEKNPFAALVFYWVEISRSIRIEGKVEKLPLAEADKYFAERPRPSQIAAHVSVNQSAPIESRDVLTQREINLIKEFQDQSVSRPDFWGGYLVIPDRIEFWQGQKNRMHDRIVFQKGENISTDFLHQGENGWVYQRLEP